MTTAFQAGLVEQLATGMALPASWYTDRTVADAEWQHVFSRSWHYVARADQLQHPGDYVSGQIAHVPVVVVCGDDGDLRAFVNVCRHRGAEVVHGTGNRRALQCPYHAWTYGLDGALRAAPRSNLDPGFCGDSLGLVPLQAAEWGPLVFVNLDRDAEPILDHLKEVESFFTGGGLRLAGLEFDCRQEWMLDSNWKIGIEGFLECYHCPLVHPQTSHLAETNPSLFTYRLGDRSLCVVQPSKGGNAQESMYANQRDGEVEHTMLAYVWPNITLAVYPGRSSLYVDEWIPTGVRETRRVRDRFFAPDVPRELRDEMIAVEREVSDQDAVIVASVQRGLDSGFVSQGRLLVGAEPLVHRFQTMVAETLGRECPS